MAVSLSKYSSDGTWCIRQHTVVEIEPVSWKPHNPFDLTKSAGLGARYHLPILSNHPGCKYQDGASGSVCALNMSSGWGVFFLSFAGASGLHRSRAISVSLLRNMTHLFRGQQA